MNALISCRISAPIWIMVYQYSVFKVQFYNEDGINLVSIPSVGLSGLEPPTSRLSGVRSNQLSYKPS